MKILKIVIKGQYFDEIAARTKKIEFREMSPFWQSRLYDAAGKKRVYDVIEFINGYNKNARRMEVKFEGFKIKAGVFNILLGDILSMNA
ncbi:MAG: hypothetical protein ABIU77_08215 [Ferruginibacter sp.]